MDANAHSVTEKATTSHGSTHTAQSLPITQSTPIAKSTPTSNNVNQLIKQYSLTGNDELIDRGWKILKPQLFEEKVFEEKAFERKGQALTPNILLHAAWLAQAEHRFTLRKTTLISFNYTTQ